MLSPQFDIYEQLSMMLFGYVADIGCGTGFGTQLFARNCKKVMGFDVDEKAVKFANRTFSNGKVNFYQADINDSIRGAAGMDFVVMIDVIEHIREDSAAVNACRDLLGKGGAFICSTPNRLSRYRKSEYHVREYSPTELKQLLIGSFETVDLMDFQLNPMESEYENPIVAICRKGDI